jgi:hypothetical protein
MLTVKDKLSYQCHLICLITFFAVQLGLVFRKISLLEVFMDKILLLNKNERDEP